jgi:hypothetical protein
MDKIGSSPNLALREGPCARSLHQPVSHDRSFYGLLFHHSDGVMPRKPSSVVKRRPNLSEYDYPSLLALTCILVFGCMVGWLVSQAWAGSGSDISVFRRDTWYTIWSATNAIACAVWLLLGYSGFRLLRHLLPVTRPGVRGWRSQSVNLVVAVVGSLVLGIVMTALGMVFVLRFREGVPLAYFDLRVTILTVIAVAGSLPSVAGLWWILLEARDLARTSEDAGQADPDVLQMFTRYQESAQSFLSMLATAVAAGVAVASALRRALIRLTDYPTELVLLFGALFALAVAFVYLPTAMALRQAGRVLRDIAARHLLSGASDQPADKVVRWLELQDYRDRLDKALGLQLGVVDRIQLALGLLAPFLISVLDAALPGVK